MLLNALAIVYGTFVALFPERAIDYLTRLVLVGYENPDDLEASGWYVALVRIEGVLLVAAGALAIGLEAWLRGDGESE